MAGKKRKRAKSSENDLLKTATYKIIEADDPIPTIKKSDNTLNIKNEPIILLEKEEHKRITPFVVLCLISSFLCILLGYTVAYLLIHYL